jgi:RNA polymerase sigma factor (sigma-70 family)
MTNDQFGAAFEIDGGYKKTVAALIRRGVNRNFACEIAQAAWVRAWEHVSELRDETKILGWTMAIAHRMWLTSFRQPVSTSISELRCDPAFADSADPSRLDLYRALAKCKPRERLVIEALLNGHSRGELAEMSGKSLPAIHAELSRARKTLRQHMRVDRQVLSGACVSRKKVQGEIRTRLS